MATLNKVFLIGNLTRDPELRVTPKGTPLCQFGLAINNSFKADDGTKRDDTTFVDAEAWGKTAELVTKYLAKGSPAMLEGRLKLDQWEDKATGAKRSKLKVVVENVQFLSSKGEQREEETDKTTVYNEPPKSTPTGGALRNPQPQENIDEDVPFN